MRLLAERRAFRKSRHGITILGDLSWMLVFCICAMIIFIFLYKPLVEKQITQKTGTSIAGLRIGQVYSDAEYVTLGLKETKPISGANGLSASDFIDTVRELAEARALTDDDDAFHRQVDTSSYVKTLDTVFGKSSPFWTGATYTLVDGTTVSERTAIAIVIRSNDKWLPQTCKEYDEDGPSDTGLCSDSAISFSGARTTIDPDTSIPIPDFGKPVEPGSLHIPITSGSATLYVFIARGER